MEMKRYTWRRRDTCGDAEIRTEMDTHTQMKRYPQRWRGTHRDEEIHMEMSRCRGDEELCAERERHVQRWGNTHGGGEIHAEMGRYKQRWVEINSAHLEIDRVHMEICKGMKRYAWR
jgi:hypothetical protein